MTSSQIFTTVNAVVDCIPSTRDEVLSGHKVRLSWLKERAITWGKLGMDEEARLYVAEAIALEKLIASLGGI